METTQTGVQRVCGAGLERYAGTVRRRARDVAAAALVIAAPGDLAAQRSAVDAPLSEPLPLEVIVSLRSHAGRSPVSFSPDGAWLAHTIDTADRLTRGPSRVYTATGVPLFEGDARPEATLSSTDGRRQIRLGDAESSSWAPVWSPRGDRVAFFSDADGVAGLWIWDRASGETRRIGNMIVRPSFGFETSRWSSDGERLLVEVLPPGVTIEAANAHSIPDAEREQREARPDELSVTVRRSAAAQAAGGEEEQATSPDGDPFERFTATYIADLVMVDPETGTFERLVERTRISWYEFSPADRYVVYTALAGTDAGGQQSLYDIRLVDVATGADRLVAGDVPLAYGVEWSWSPAGDRFAYTRSGLAADGAITIVHIADGGDHVVESDRAGFAGMTGETRPVWSPDGAGLYAVADDALWRIDAATGATAELARLEGWRMRHVVPVSYLSAVAWSPDGGETVWATAREADGPHAGILAVETATGVARVAQRQHRTFGLVFSLAANPASGQIVVAASDQHSPAELWLFDTASGETTQASRINAALSEYTLGETRVIHWTTADGEARSGALLLPPGHDRGTPVPLVVWLYGGAMGSAAANRFGLWAATPAFNMQVLATRGYAVLFPDAPVRTGRITEDLVASVIPGVDAAIDQGYADPARLAIMGQSYGSLNVLALITRTDRFGAAIITAAVLHPDLYADYVANPGYYERGQGNMGGTIWEHDERYRENSPLFDFPEIQTPLLIGIGSLDGNQVPAEAVFTALDRLGKHVEYRVYDGESHVVTGRANVIDLWQRRLEFLAEHLGLSTDMAGRVR
jgi:dipeptidyl aminopeptidase/acylaminoacyl peptidase